MKIIKLLSNLFIVVVLFSCDNLGKQKNLEKSYYSEDSLKEDKVFNKSKKVRENRRGKKYQLTDLQGTWSKFKDEDENANFIIEGNTIRYFEATKDVLVMFVGDSLSIMHDFDTINFYIKYVNKDSLVMKNEFSQELVFYRR